MTPEQLHEALEARRAELGRYRWQLCVDLDCGLYTLSRMRHGHVSDGMRARAERWLRKRTPPRTE
ncbi:hypothetical protein OIE66_40595 [Nonomuraea sp. NBC_01738]|uniref:hypothetical protein n=1 Tax=Nonomuraea sp. NBC_01738 TaxID=2976003 RepID=UPI002E0E469A|nr:hypothetical protein OIE66_40595 [Nonomuraea sp. NBC_01738]